MLNFNYIYNVSPTPCHIFPVRYLCLKYLLDATVLQIISACEMEESVQGELMKNKLKEIKEQAIAINFDILKFKLNFTIRN